MRVAAVALLVGLGIVLAMNGGEFPRNEVRADAVAGQAHPKSASGNDLLAMSMEISEGRQQITVIDPKTQAMAVYQVERVSGQITLKSVRNLTWDLRIDEFNSGNPSPKEIRAMIDPR